MMTAIPHPIAYQLLTVYCTFLVVVLGDSPSPRKPHIILIIADDLVSGMLSLSIIPIQ